MPAPNAIYMDYNATTPVDPRVVEAMLPFLTETFGNPSSGSHAYGQEAMKAVDRARGQVADLIGADEAEIVFTSGATESNNLAIKGALGMYGEKGTHLVTCQTEHNAVLDPFRKLDKAGVAQATFLPPDEFGRVSAEQVADALTDQTILISLMLANNETGTIHPLAEIGRLAKERGVLLHSDATQAVGKIPVDVEAMGVDLLSLSGHKVYAPKGVGALYVRGHDPRVRLTSQMDGGGHQGGRRSGTLNVPGIVALGKACEIAQAEMEAESARQADLRDRLERGLTEGIERAKVNGHPSERLPNTLNISFAFVEGESIMLKMPHVAVSSGSACTSSSLSTSHVLAAMGVGDDMGHGSLRLSVGRSTTAEQVDEVIELVTSAVSQLREMSPLFEMSQAGVDISKLEWTGHEH